MDNYAIPATVNVILPALFPRQRTIVDDSARFKVIVCGRRWGKTQTAAWEALRRALRGQLVWWVAPTAEVTRRGWRKIIPLAQRIPGVDIRRALREIEFPGGGLIGFKTGDSDSGLLGEGLDYLIVDEAALVRETAWTQELRPALSDREGGAMFISTPRGQNWFWRAYLLGVDPERADWQSWRFPTSTNPVIKASEIEAARELLPARAFEQEYLAEFLADGGVVFRNITAACTAPHPAQPAQHRGHDIVIGADWGKSNDYSVFTAVCRTCRHMVDFDRMNVIDYALQVGRLQNMVARWNRVTVYPETNSMGEPIIEQLERAGLTVREFTTTAQSKPPLIESLALAIERGEIGLQDIPVLVGELQAYTMTLNKITGRPTYSAPDAMHDDCVMSLALAWHGCTQAPAAMQRVAQRGLYLSQRQTRKAQPLS